MDRNKIFKDVKRVVIKIGTNLIIGKDPNPKKAWLTDFVKDIHKLRKKGYEFVIVSSGAIGTGMQILNINKKPKQLPFKQACAAVGQNQLMRLYARIFGRCNITVGQVLLTVEDLWQRNRYFNLRNTINTLISLGVVPIINENDSVAVHEIKVGDNDTLSAHVTNFVEADLLIILTDIDGLHEEDPKKNKKAKLISEVNSIDSQIKACCGGKGSEASTGGMQTKIKAAEIVTRSGEMMLIADGFKEKISDILKGKKIGTLFLSSGKRLSSHKRWIAFSRKIKGGVYIDKGGVEAIVEKNKSLLPVGIKKVEGVFEKEDFIGVYTMENEKIARGITNYSSFELEKIKGHKSSQIAEILGKSEYEEVIHKDNLVLLNTSSNS